MMAIAEAVMLMALAAAKAAIVATAMVESKAKNRPIYFDS